MNKLNESETQKALVLKSKHLRNKSRSNGVRHVLSEGLNNVLDPTVRRVRFNFLERLFQHMQTVRINLWTKFSTKRE